MNIQETARLEEKAARGQCSVGTVKMLIEEVKRLSIRDKTAKYHVYKMRCDELTAEVKRLQSELDAARVGMYQMALKGVCGMCDMHGKKTIVCVNCEDHGKYTKFKDCFNNEDRAPKPQTEDKR